MEFVILQMVVALSCTEIQFNREAEDTCYMHITDCVLDGEKLNWCIKDYKTYPGYTNG